MKERWKGSALLSPLPAVLVSCGNGANKNVFTVAWTGIVCSHPPKTYISVRKERYSYDLIKESGVFVINIPKGSLVKATDFCGVKSGRDTDKFQAMGLTAEQCFDIDTVSVGECPVSIECKVTDVIPLGSHDMFLADILCVQVDEEYIEDGKLRLDKCKLFAYAHGEYFELGKKIGSFGYSVTKKSTKRKRALKAQGKS